mgnify:CR=1 FL=1
MEQKATHRLVVNFCWQVLLDDSVRQSITSAFVDRVNGRKYKKVLGPSHSMELIWNKEEAFTFWTTSKLTNICIGQMTREMLSEVCSEVRQDLKLAYNTCQISMKMAEIDDV